MGPLPGVPRAPNSLPLVPSTMWAQRPSESKVRRKGRWEGGSREAVMIGVLGHRVLRHNRATLNVKAKRPRLGSLPHLGFSRRQWSGEPDTSADPITGDWAAT